MTATSAVSGRTAAITPPRARTHAVSRRVRRRPPCSPRRPAPRPPAEDGRVLEGAHDQVATPRGPGRLPGRPGRRPRSRRREQDLPGLDLQRAPPPRPGPPPAPARPRRRGRGPTPGWRTGARSVEHGFQHFRGWGPWRPRCRGKSSAGNYSPAPAPRPVLGRAGILEVNQEGGYWRSGQEDSARGGVRVPRDGRGRGLADRHPSLRAGRVSRDGAHRHGRSRGGWTAAPRPHLGRPAADGTRAALLRGHAAAGPQPDDRGEGRHPRASGPGRRRRARGHAADLAPAARART